LSCFKINKKIFKCLTQLPGVQKALANIVQESHLPEAVSEAKTLEKQVCEFDFLVLLHFWNSILKPVDKVNKIIQGEKTNT